MPSNGSGVGTYGIGKTVSGTFYPAITKSNQYTAATGATVLNNVNLLDGPITLAAGESITMSSNITSNFAFPRNSTFTLDNTGSNPGIYDIEFANSIYMAVGRCGGNSSAFVATSSDGINWTQQVGAQSYNTFTDVAYISTGSLWVAISGSTFVYSTNNGVTWSITGTLPDTSLTPYKLATNGTTTIAAYVGSGSTHNVWYTTNGTTWTAATNFQGNLNYGGTVTATEMKGFSYSGSHFVVSQVGSTQVTTDFTNWQFLGCTQNNPFGVAQGLGMTLRYSSAYGRYYQPYLSSANANRSISMSGTSADSKVWQYTTTSPAVAYCQVECAGANTVLIAKPDVVSNVRAKSTDGVNFTAATDIRNYQGLVIGLANGYYYTQAGNASGQWYASTDPTTSNGTLFTASPTMQVANGAADPVSGAWIIVGQDPSSDNVQIGGATATTGGSTALTPFVKATYGFPMDICWHSTDSKFYIVSQKGGIFSATATNAVAGTWTFLGWVTGAVASNSQRNIIVVNNTIYVTSLNRGNGIDIAPVSTSLSFVNYALPSMYGNVVAAKGSSTLWNYNIPVMATNGTNIVCGGVSCFVSTWVPANSRSLPSSPYAGVARIDLVNGNQIAYGGNSNNTTAGGIYSSTNCVTTYGFASYVGNQNAGQTFPMYQKAGFASSNYYVTLSGSGVMASSTSPTAFSTLTSYTTNSVAGVESLSPNFLATNGSTLVYYVGNNAELRTSVTTAPARSSSTVTASIVEIT